MSSPRSHRMGHPPLHTPLECDDPSVVPIEAPAGSVVVWHGGLWHGGLPRTIDGVRRTLVLYYGRAHLEAQEPYKFTTTMEMLERKSDAIRCDDGPHRPDPVGSPRSGRRRGVVRVRHRPVRMSGE